ncbi:MAG: 1-phosphofructokinase family hexose kinase [Bacteroidetes bacterium]|nr:1-phosphofructokinase family hexose kinase [Bacteroidota bacterium]
MASESWSEDSVKSILTVTMNPVIDKSCSVDHVVAERKLRCGPPQFNPGGGGINVSRAIRNLGGKSMAFYPVGGMSGQLFQNLLVREGIEHYPVFVQGTVRENLGVLEEATGQQFRFGMPGPALSEEEWQRCLRALSLINPRPDYIVASGSLPPGVPDDFYARVAKIAAEHGSRLVLDTSGEPLRQAVDAGVYMVKANMREAWDLVGLDNKYEFQVEAAAAKIIERCQCEAVVISLGAGGALGVSKDGYQRVRAPAVPVVSRIGAGDSMVAGLVLSLARGRSLRDALRFGVAAGTAAVMTPASELCRREDTERLYERTVLEVCSPYTTV